ncbi:MAG: hypothetical protein AAFQ84_08735 [Pseudomonadota bacterium]
MKTEQSSRERAEDLIAAKDDIMASASRYLVAIMLVVICIAAFVSFQKGTFVPLLIVVPAALITAGAMLRNLFRKGNFE